MSRQYLNFHGVGTPPHDVSDGERRVWIDATRFEALLDVVAGADSVEVVLTFDDGNASDVDRALPALSARGLKASFFVLAGRLDTPGYLSRAQLVELAGEGMGVGSHGMHHRNWRGLDDRELGVELHDARRAIEEAVGRPVTEAACPFGSYDRRVLGRLRRAGYERVYTSDGGPARQDTWLVPRTSLAFDATPEALDDLLRRPQISYLREAKRIVKRLR